MLALARVLGWAGLGCRGSAGLPCPIAPSRAGGEPVPACITRNRRYAVAYEFIRYEKEPPLARIILDQPR